MVVSETGVVFASIICLGTWKVEESPNGGWCGEKQETGVENTLTQREQFCGHANLGAE